MGNDNPSPMKKTTSILLKWFSGLGEQQRALRIVFLCVLFVGDRLLKNYIWFSLPRGDMHAFLYPVLNTDISFSLPVPPFFMGLLLPLLAIIIVALAVETVYLYRKSDMMFVWWGLITVGALSNLLDRMVLGGVLDYINLNFWPVFNMSDVYISVGIGMVLLYELMTTRSRHDI
jgi:signal peptidase II